MATEFPGSSLGSVSCLELEGARRGSVFKQTLVQFSDQMLKLQRCLQTSLSWWPVPYQNSGATRMYEACTGWRWPTARSQRPARMLAPVRLLHCTPWFCSRAPWACFRPAPLWAQEIQVGRWAGVGSRLCRESAAHRVYLQQEPLPADMQDLPVCPCVCIRASPVLNASLVPGRSGPALP